MGLYAAQAIDAIQHWESDRHISPTTFGTALELINLISAIHKTTTPFTAIARTEPHGEPDSGFVVLEIAGNGITRVLCIDQRSIELVVWPITALGTIGDRVAGGVSG